MGRGRPGGNPQLKHFGYGRLAENPTEEPMVLLAVRVEKPLIEKIKSGENWQVKFRAKLREIYGDTDAPAGDRGRA